MIYLNNAATSFPKPQTVIDAVNRSLQMPPISTGRTTRSHPLSNIVDETRNLISILINAQTQNDIFFFQNATQALNQAILGIVEYGDHIVSTVTEHNSVIRPLSYLEKKFAVSVDYISCDKSGKVDPVQVIDAVKKNTKLVIINHVSNVTGVIQDVNEIGSKLSQLNTYLLVDASQSLGVYPVDITHSGIDMLVFTGHKFLYGVQGIGGIYVSPGVELTPLIHGGTGVLSERLSQPKQRPWCFQAGTMNIPGIVSLNAGLHYINQHQFIQCELLQISLFLYEKLQDIEELGLISPKNTAVISAVCSQLELDDIDLILEESFNIKIRTGLHCAPKIHQPLGCLKGTLRFSPSIFTTEKEINSTASAMKKVITQLRKSK
ncbi:aminotransferase class V-fold PLP-dependent enzyme [Aliikangiella sp. IMCC44359]|uniref:aminotransferase class V-fold PLP-dependent enzyme n=1 Tax=Aliikangiella sp. IMCC44359 TaxID=3459125 RepID=UPI00403AC932